jgi:hypothetical protein
LKWARVFGGVGSNRFSSREDQGEPSDCIRRMREVRATFGPGEKGNSRPRPRFRPGRRERGRQPRPWAGFGSRTRAGPTKRNGPRAKISSTATAGLLHGRMCKADLMGLMLGRSKERERKPRWARLAELRVSVHGGLRARTVKRKGMVLFFRSSFFYVSCLNLCRFLNQWDKIVRE